MSSVDQHAPSSPVAPEQPGATNDHPPLVIRPLWDPGLATVGFDPRSTYVERYWLGVLGPSAVMLLRRLSRGLEEHPEGFQIALADTARAIGLGAGTGRQSPINRTIERACMFGAMRRISATEVEVRTHLPRLSARQLARLPLAVQHSHRAWLAQQGALAPACSVPPNGG